MKNFTSFFFVLALLLFSFASNAQVIVYTQGGVSTITSNLATALANADSASIVYLSGGTFGAGLGNVTLTKSLNLVGAGYNPDSAAATGKTFITTTFILDNGASNSSFTGIDFEGAVQSCNTTTLSILFSRCFFGGGINAAGNQAGPPQNTFNFSECIFASGTTGNNICNNSGFRCNATFDRCLFTSNIDSWQLSTSFTHCTFGLAGTPTHITGCQFQNCVFFNSNLPGWTNTVSGNTFVNCITTDSALTPGSTNANCLLRVPADSIFVNGANPFPFGFSNNYQLSNSSPGHNYATDATDCGIFGTVFPFKAGGIPYNPHFITNNIAPATNTSGQLNLNLKVAAQTR